MHRDVPHPLDCCRSTLQDTPGLTEPQDLQLVHDISQRGRLEVLDLSQTAVRVGEPLCRALLLSVAGLTVLSAGETPRRWVRAVAASVTAGGRLPLRELSLGGNACALSGVDGVHVLHACTRLGLQGRRGSAG